jgi:hypothetical protein
MAMAKNAVMVQEYGFIVVMAVTTLMHVPVKAMKFQ